MVPAFVVVALGIDATRALVLSQVVLSLILPVPMIALLILARRRDVMGSYANGRLTKAAATAIVLALNLLLVLQNRRRSFTRGCGRRRLPSCLIYPDLPGFTRIYQD